LYLSKFLNTSAKSLSLSRSFYVNKHVLFYVHYMCIHGKNGFTEVSKKNLTRHRSKNNFVEIITLIM